MLLVVGAMLAAVATSFSAPAASSAAWSVKSPPVAFDSSSSVWCASEGFCADVGNFGGVTGGSPLAENWTPTKETGQTVPIPEGSSAASLLSVSCHVAELCTAVGSSTVGGKAVTLAEHLSASKWAVQTTPNPSEAKETTLGGVSCSSSELCTAVGRYVTGAGAEVTLAERWNGTAWSIQTTPNPKEAKTSGQGAILTSVSCTSSTSCFAVGRYINTAGTELTLAEHWNGTEWSIQTTPNPAEAKASRLVGVSCAESQCTAVGRYTSSAGTELTLAEHWTETEWVIQATPNPKEAKASSLASVSCVSSNRCQAVGRYTTSAGVEVSLAESRWNVTEWTILTTPNPTGAQSSQLLGVSCGAGPCTATGKYVNAQGTTRTLEEEYNTGPWSLRSAPGASEAGKAVSCASETVCADVGWLAGLVTEIPLAERWAGTEETGQTVPIPGSSNASYSFSGVSCHVVDVCTAVGISTTGGGSYVPLAEHLSASKWAVQTTPNPSEAKETTLGGVSCSSSELCTAVGRYVTGAGAEVTLAERWNGTAWSIQTTPNPKEAKTSGQGAILTSVSCTSSTSCFAVGRYINTAGTELTLAEHWNGTEWSIQTTPNPAEAKASRLVGVSCAESQCTAVGRYTSSAGTELTLAEHWTETEWVIQATPNPKEAKASSLASVSCVSSNRCQAVGRYTTSAGAEVPLAERRWNATEWTVETPPNPTGAQNSGLAGVSCEPLRCMATGSYGPAGETRTLQEEYH
jgi:hypothetical protein